VTVIARGSERESGCGEVGEYMHIQYTESLLRKSVMYDQEIM